MHFALIAGEASGDLLGAALIEALRARFPQARFSGVTGPRMSAAGCESLATIDRLSVMGLAEVLPKIPDILALRRDLRRTLQNQRPDCVIGIDAPDFNLPLERRLRKAGLRTVQVVSPTVWAWRPGRVKSIVRAVDRLLCLFPFEPAFYAQHAQRDGFRAIYIGHPLAEDLAVPPTRAEARRSLGLPSAGPVLAVLPGSRGSELRFLGATFAATAARLHADMPELRCVVPIARPALRPLFEQAIAAHAPQLPWTLVDGQSREVICASDAVLVASGTATLECLLLQRPMVVAYRVAAFSAWLARRLHLLNTEHVSLPNLLCAHAVVPERLQEQANPEALSAALRPLLGDPAAAARQVEEFAAVAATLRCGAAQHAAAAVAELVQSPA